MLLLQLFWMNPLFKRFLEFLQLRYQAHFEVKNTLAKLLSVTRGLKPPKQRQSGGFQHRVPPLWTDFHKRLQDECAFVEPWMRQNWSSRATLHHAAEIQ